MQRVLDLVVTILSYAIAYIAYSLITDKEIVFSLQHAILLLLIIPSWVILIRVVNLAHLPRVRTYMSIFFSFLNLTLIGYIFLFLYKLVFQLNEVTLQFILVFSNINLVLLFLYRIVLFRAYKLFRIKGRNVHNVLILADDDSESIIDSILEHKEWGYRVLMIFTDSDKIKKKYNSIAKIYPTAANVNSIIKYDIVDEVLYCRRDFDVEYIGELNTTCKELGVIFRVKTNVSPVHFADAQMVKLNKEPFLTFMNTPNYSLGWIWKLISDYLIALSLLFFLSPVFIGVALIIKLTSKGPAFFKQKRVGVRGRQFYIYKFRTMVQDAEELKKKLMAANESDGPTFKIKRDPRITPIGRFLRATSIDELPQLLNVLKGEMSLIGPRPPLPEEVEQYERWQLRRLSVKPGITCTWQIVPNRNDVVFEKWMKLDIQYIENWSLKSDIALFFKTIRSVFTSRGY